MVDKTIFITGGSRGIGHATVRAFLKEGAKVAFCALHKDGVSKAEKDLSQLGEVKGYVCDVSDWKAVERVSGEVSSDFGSVDVLVNNAGVLWEGNFSEEPVDSISKLVDINLKGVLYVSRAFLPKMLEMKRGVIVNVASGAGKTAYAEIATYSATKFGVVGFTKALAKEVLGSGVKIFGVCPGTVATDMIRDLGWSGGMPPENVAEKILELSVNDHRVPEGHCLDI